VTQLFDGDHLAKALQRVSVDVFELLKGQAPDDVVFVGILTNGVFFAKRIQHKLKKRSFDVTVPVMALDISLYRDDFSSKKDYMSVVTNNNLNFNLDGKHVVLFDDVLSTARTARAALNAIFDFGRPEKVSFVVLFDRKNRQVPIEPNVVGEVLDVDRDLRVNVGFFEVKGEDNVVTAPFSD
jgi:pyrimidine operon attenuation protein/uracil phosphoribosyltransferase